MLRRSGSVVGVDIGSSAIKAVELKGAGAELRVVAVGSEPVPSGAVLGGVAADATVVSHVLRCLLDRLGTQTRNVVAALSSRAAIVKRITVPAMSDLELAASIEWEAEQHIPFELDEVNFDYHRVDSDAGARPQTMDVLVVAARKETVANLAGVIRNAGRAPVIIDVIPFALGNVLEANYDEPYDVVALVDAGASMTTVHVLSGRTFLFTREAAAGESPTDLVRGAFDSVAASGRTSGIDRILLTGGATQSSSFSEALVGAFDVPIENLNPFRQMTFASGLSASSVAAAAATSAVAVGLALRRVGDR